MRTFRRNVELLGNLWVLLKYDFLSYKIWNIQISNFDLSCCKSCIIGNWSQDAKLHLGFSPQCKNLSLLCVISKYSTHTILSDLLVIDGSKNMMDYVSKIWIPRLHMEDKQYAKLFLLPFHIYDGSISSWNRIEI